MSKHLFILDPIERLKPQDDTSLCMAHALNKLDQEVYFVTGNDFFVHNGTFKANAIRLLTSDDIKDKWSPKIMGGDTALMSASDFSSIQMRKEPPCDTYYYNMLSVLQAAQKDTWVCNCPKGIKTVHEKMSIFDWSENIVETIVSSNIDEILNFIHKNGKIIIKPLSYYNAYGINIVTESDPDLFVKLRYLLDSRGANYLHNNSPQFLMCQKYMSEIENGEKRIYILNGCIQGAILKKPSKGSAITSYDYGGYLEKCELDAEETQVCSKIAQWLLKEKIYIAGIDMINRKIIEINVTCPGLFQGYNRLNEYYLEKEVAEFIIDKSKS